VVLTRCSIDSDVDVFPTSARRRHCSHPFRVLHFSGVGCLLLPTLCSKNRGEECESLNWKVPVRVRWPIKRLLFLHMYVGYVVIYGLGMWGLLGPKTNCFLFVRYTVCSTLFATQMLRVSTIPKFTKFWYPVVCSFRSCQVRFVWYYTGCFIIPSGISEVCSSETN
jgi:hypothetical protein